MLIIAAVFIIARILENVNHAFKVENVTYDPLHGLDGYKMVDIHHVLNWAMKMSLNHAKICTLGQVEFRKEERKGLFNTFTFGCTVCNKKLVQTSEPLENPKVNKACVWGTLTSGSYYTQMNHLFSVMDIPTISPKSFRMTECNLGQVWRKHLWEEIIEAGKNEKRIAIEKGHVSEDGVPYVTAYVDGGWSKRSYGHNFNGDQMEQKQKNVFIWVLKINSV